MNEKFGGKQQVVQNTAVSADEDLGPHPAVHQGAPQSAPRRLGRGGGTKRASRALPSGTDLKPKPGETQCMVLKGRRKLVPWETRQNQEAPTTTRPPPVSTSWRGVRAGVLFFFQPRVLFSTKPRRWRWGLILRVSLTRLCVDKQVSAATNYKQN